MLHLIFKVILMLGLFFDNLCLGIDMAVSRF